MLFFDLIVLPHQGRLLAGAHLVRLNPCINLKLVIPDSDPGSEKRCYFDGQTTISTHFRP